MLKSIQAILLIMFLPLLCWGQVQPLISKQNNAAIVEIYIKKLQAVFLQASELSKRQPRFSDYIQTLFRIDSSNPHTSALIDSLKSIATPRVVLCGSDCLEVIPKEGPKFYIKLGTKLGEVIIEDRPNKKESHNHWLRHNKLWSLALPKADASYALLIALGAGTLKLAPIVIRTVLGKSLQATAAGTATGAVVGCGANIHMRWDNESYSQACKNGASEGASIMLAANSFDRINSATDNQIKALANPASFSILKKLGALGIVYSFVHAGTQLSKLNGVELRCGQQEGSFSVQALAEGSTRNTLYEVTPTKIEFLDEKYQPIASELTEDKLTQFVNNFSDFKKLTPTQVKPIISRLLLEIDSYKLICKEHGRGYKEKEYFSEGKKLDQAIKAPAPAPVLVPAPNAR